MNDNSKQVQTQKSPLGKRSSALANLGVITPPLGGWGVINFFINSTSFITGSNSNLLLMSIPANCG